MKYCCEKFAEEAQNAQAAIGGGALYSNSNLKPVAQFEKQADGTWSIYGCCGGGCYVVEQMKFCPFCGLRLTEKTT